MAVDKGAQGGGCGTVHQTPRDHRTTAPISVTSQADATRTNHFMISGSEIIRENDLFEQNRSITPTAVGDMDVPSATGS